MGQESLQFMQAWSQSCCSKSSQFRHSKSMQAQSATCKSRFKASWQMNWCCFRDPTICRFNLVYEKLPTLPRCCLPQRWIDEVGKPFVHIFYSCLEYYCSRKQTYLLLYIVDGSLVVCRHCLFCIKSILWAPIGVFLFSLLDALELWS